jgi:D-3-phosphoglycerate dehydrogenase / 2-oxoglutarate reductase
MTDPVDALVLDLLEWIGTTSRPYPEVMDAWRTSCPRLPVWEDANDRGFVERRSEPGRGAVVTVSTDGLRYLRQHRIPQQVPN